MVDKYDTEKELEETKKILALLERQRKFCEILDRIVKERVTNTSKRKLRTRKSKGVGDEST